jgi:hypothetical protein
VSYKVFLNRVRNLPRCQPANTRHRRSRAQLLASQPTDKGAVVPIYGNRTQTASTHGADASDQLLFNREQNEVRMHGVQALAIETRGPTRLKVRRHECLAGFVHDLQAG